MHDDKSDKFKIAFVQPVQSPYWTLRLKALTLFEDLKLTLLLERGSFSHRPGWEPEPIPGVDVEVIGSTVISSVIEGFDLGYKIHGVRSIPFRLVATLIRKRPNVVVVCNAIQLFFASIARLFVRCKIALIVEDTPHATRNLSKLLRAIKGLIYRRADAWFAFSEDARAFLAGIQIQQNVIRTSWSVDMNSFRPAECLENESVGVPTAPADRVVLFVGMLIEIKGVLQLLEAWRSLPADLRASSRLVLVGDGPLKSNALEFVAHHRLEEVSILGQRPYDEVKKIMAHASLFVLPTLKDLFSLTVLEAMASGCPVITTPYNGARELVTEGYNGWIANPTQPGELMRTLEHALSPQTNLAEMGKRARERVMDMDNNIVMARFADALRSLVR